MSLDNYIPQYFTLHCICSTQTIPIIYSLFMVSVCFSSIVFSTSSPVHLWSGESPFGPIFAISSPKRREGHPPLVVKNRKIRLEKRYHFFRSVFHVVFNPKHVKILPLITTYKEYPYNVPVIKFLSQRLESKQSPKK